MTAWLVDVFPLPQRALSLRAGANTSRSRITNGLNGQRQRYPGQENFINVAWEMKMSVFAQFLAFHEFAINLGSDWFSIPLPIGPATGDLYVDTVVRLVDGQFKFTYREPVHYLVTAELEMQVRQTITEAELDDLLAGAVDDPPTDYLMVEEDRSVIYTPVEDDEDDDYLRTLLIRD